SFFTENVLGNFISTLVSRYMKMTDEDLELWSSDPETFCNNQDMDDWDYHVKHCAEHLFLSTLDRFSDKLAPFIVNMTHKVLKGINTNLQQLTKIIDTYGSFEKHKLLLRDACYSAIGWGAYNLYEKINFMEWFKKELIKEIEIKDPRYKIIRRRVCWLLGRWVERINRHTR